MHDIRRFMTIVEEVVPYQEQYRQKISSPEFKAWFRNSKVVNENGQPMLVYHGRPEKWKSMEVNSYQNYLDALKQAGLLNSPDFKSAIAFRERLGDVVWFTDDEHVAYGYYDEAPNGDVLEAFLSIQNPLDLRMNVIGLHAVNERLSTIYDAEIKIEHIEGNSSNTARRDIANQIVYDNSVVMKWARDHGHDGVMHDDTCIRGRHVHTSYVVFKPTQIKAWDNQGTWSRTSPNIYK